MPGSTDNDGRSVRVVRFGQRFSRTAGCFTFFAFVHSGKKTAGWVQPAPRPVTPLSVFAWQTSETEQLPILERQINFASGVDRDATLGNLPRQVVAPQR